MKGFKNQLRQELQQDAPFTMEVKQRLLQSRSKRKKRNWQVLTVSVALCALIGIILFTQFAPQNSVLTASENETLLPLLDDVTGLEVIEPEYARLLGEQWILRSFPMVIDKEAPITYGDYVVYNTPTGIVASTVLGLANDSVTMDEGQIKVNGTVLKMRGLGEKIDEAIENDPFKNPYYFYESKVIFSPFVNETIQVAKDELVIYSPPVGKSGHQLLTIKDEQLIGKVTAIQATDKLEFTLNPEEQLVYEAFKMDHDLEHLRDISPVAIVKMFLLSDIDQDYETYEALFSTSENLGILETKKYYEKTKAVRQQLFTPEINRLIIARDFNGIEYATFDQRSDIEGWVVFKGENGLPSEVRMEKNEQGIWQPAFSRAIIMPLQ